MSYRGRLIFPMLARIGRIDPNAMASDPDGAGELTSGFDDDFREPVRVPDGTQAGAPARLEFAPIDIPAQVEDQEWRSLNMEMTGNDPRTSITLVFHFADLERLGFVDPVTKGATCPVIGDRLIAIVDPNSGSVEQKAPGIYCVHAEPRSYGLGARRRNLLVCTFTERGKAR